MTIDFQTSPENYKHWRLEVDADVAYLTMDVDEQGGLKPGYELKMNSYDLGVDIELSDAIQRLRFEHPQVGAVVVRSAKDRIFCAGANIRMLGVSSHAHKVNFCKFTNETRNAMEDASENSGQRYISAINGTAAGGGYELALATDHIMLVDDGSAAVSLPEVPLLAVLPGTGGLTRVVDKRYVRRDLADVFCTLEEGIRGKRAVQWRLVDEVAPSSRFDAAVEERARAVAGESDRPKAAVGIQLTPLDREISDDGLSYSHLVVRYDRGNRTATLRVAGPSGAAPQSASDIQSAGASTWTLALARELDDALLWLRTNEIELARWYSKPKVIWTPSWRTARRLKISKTIGWFAKFACTGNVCSSASMSRPGHWSVRSCREAASVVYSLNSFSLPTAPICWTVSLRMTTHRPLRSH